MFEVALLSVLIIAICVCLLCIRILFVKKGKFPNTHVGGNREMRKRGIGCAQSQDREAREENPMAVPEREQDVNKK